MKRPNNLKAVSDMPPDVPIVGAGVEYDVTPCGDFLLVEQQQGDETTAGGVVLPEAARAGWMPRWKILKVGPGRVGPEGTIVPVRVAVGEMIIIAPEVGHVFEFPDTRPKRALVAESAVLCTVALKGVH